MSKGMGTVPPAKSAGYAVGWGYAPSGRLGWVLSLPLFFSFPLSFPLTLSFSLTLTLTILLLTLTIQYYTIQGGIDRVSIGYR